MINFASQITTLSLQPTRFLIFLGLVLLASSCNLGSNQSSDDELRYPALDSVDMNLLRSREPDLTKEKRLAFLSEALKFTRDLEKDTIQKVRLSEIRKEYFDYNELESYRMVNDEIRVLAEELDDSLEIANTYFKLGYYYFKKEKVDSAYNNYYLAQRMYERMNDPFNTGKALLSMAILQKNVKDYVGSESSSVRAIEYFTPLNDLRYLASANSNLAIISKDLGKYDEAIEYNQNALEFRKKLKTNKTLQVSSLNNIGIVYSSNGQYQEAIDYFNRGLAFDSLFQKRPLTFVRLLDNLAYAKFLSGETKGFPELLLRPLILRDSLKDNAGTITSYLHLANYYKAIDSIPTANYYAKKALKTSERLKYQSEKLESLLLLSETSPVNEAIGYSKSYIRINDSLQAQERAYQDQFARIRFETDKIETENTEMNRRNKQLFIGLYRYSEKVESKGTTVSGIATKCQ
jgi:tetratricopeptide (TPR) repeat protein